MKVTITDREKKVEDRVYPYWGESDLGVIVLFRRASAGTVISKGCSTHYWSVGDYKDDWHEDNFTPLVNKTITIEV